MKRAAALLWLSASCVAAPPAPSPSPAQVRLVEERRASFPRDRLVAAVDWYQPQELVRGGHAAPIPLRAASEPFAADDVFYLDGSRGQRLYLVPSRRLVIVRIGAPSRAWDDGRLPDLVLGGLR